jgi:heptosyltransferase-2
MKKILVIQTAFLGDAILTLPLIQFLKEKYVDPKICVLAIPSTSVVFEYSPFVDDVIVYDKKGSEKSILSYIKLIMKIRKENFDEVYSPHRSVRSTIISFFSRANLTVGFDISDLSFLYKKKVKYEKSDHEVKRNLSLVEFNFDNDWHILPIVNSSKVDNEKFKEIEKIDCKKLIAVAPGSVWKTKVYPKEYFIKIIEQLIQQDFFVVLIGGKEDQNLCEKIEKEIGNKIISTAGKFSILESIELLKKCSALICNDSAPTHMAMIADIPVLTIYCSTIPDFGFYPYNKKSSFVSFDELSCKPCGIHGKKECPIKTFDCGYKLLPEKVLSKLQEIISV